MTKDGDKFNFDRTLKEMIEQIKLGRELNELNNQVAPSHQVNVGAASTNENRSRLGGIINRLVQDNDMSNMLVVTEIVTKINAGKPLCLMISAILRAPALPWKILMNNPANVIKDGTVRLRWTDGPLPWTAWFEE